MAVRDSRLSSVSYVSYPWFYHTSDSLLSRSSRLLAPELDVGEYPTSVAIKSVHNTVIESMWRWLRKTTGFNIKELILRGREERIFHPHLEYHR